jgi:phosphatidylinositol glycan class U
VYYIGYGVGSLVGWLAGLTILSLLMTKDGAYLNQSYGFLFAVRDLRPTIGVFWYFFSEMFERFRLFFLLVFHGHLFFYAPSLAIVFHREPVFLAYLLVAIPAIFKAYPVIGDTTFALCLALTNLYLLLPCMRRVYLHVYAFLQTSVIGVLMWFLWISPGSGNANFFYFQSLAFVFTNCFAVVETVGAVRRLRIIEHDIPSAGKSDSKRHKVS